MAAERNEREGISMRFTQPMVFHPESSVSVMCACGQMFNYFGVDATKKARRFMNDHQCPLKPEQRTGDETL